jgi:hypothetical protein
MNDEIMLVFQISAMILFGLGLTSGIVAVGKLHHRWFLLFLGVLLVLTAGFLCFGGFGVSGDKAKTTANGSNPPEAGEEFDLDDFIDSKQSVTVDQALQALENTFREPTPEASSSRAVSKPASPISEEAIVQAREDLKVIKDGALRRGEELLKSTRDGLLSFGKSIGRGLKMKGAFGIVAKGKRVAILVDRSGSMTGKRLAAAKTQIVNCIKDREYDTKIEYLILFFDTDVFALKQDDWSKPKALTENDKASWLTLDIAPLDDIAAQLKLVDTGGGTDPEPALKFAIRSDADEIIMITDDEIGEGDTVTDEQNRSAAVAGITKLNNKRAVIHGVQLLEVGGKPTQWTKLLAEQNGGKFVRVNVK